MQLRARNASPDQLPCLLSSPAKAERPPDRVLLRLACAVLALSPLLAQASEEESQETPPAGPGPTEVVVTASRMDIPLEKNPTGTTVVEEKGLEKTSSKTIAADEALKLVPGVRVDNQADGERVHLSIRGQGILTERGIRGFKILLDGIPLNDPMGFAPDLFDVDWATFRRVEVLRGPASVIDRTYDTPGTLFQYTLRAGAGWLKNEFSAGTDLGWQEVEERRECNPRGTCVGPALQSDETIRQWGVGLFALGRIELGPEWGVIAGMRWDRVHGELEDHLQAAPLEEKSFEKATGRVGVTWNPNPRHGLYASWGQGFLPPATEELANNPDAFGGFNTHLEPATSSGEEVGARGLLGTRGSYDVAVLRLDTENDFGRYRILPQRPLETFYRNAGSSRRYGLETLLTWNPADNLETRLAYTYSDFKYTRVTSASGSSYHDTWLPNSPRHQGYLDVEYGLTSHWVADASVEAQSQWYVDETNTSWTWGYGLLHLRLAYRWQSSAYAGEISFVARNVGDRKYIAFTEPDPGGNSYQPAAGRELFVAARFSLGGHRSA